MRFHLTLLAAIFLCSCFQEPPAPLRAVEGSSYLKRGDALVNGLAACGFCHGQKPVPGAPLSGGREVQDKYGKVEAPNITPAGSGIGDWTTTDLIEGIRNSKRPDASEFSHEEHKGYLWMSDEDALAIVAYLKSLPPVENPVEQRNLGFVSRNSHGFWKSRKEQRGYVPAIRPVEKESYGKYLVDNVAQCGLCHNSPEGLWSSGDYLGGGKQAVAGDQVRTIPGLTGSRASGIGAWSAEEIVQYLKTGQTPSKKQIDPALCPYKFYSTAPQHELEAVASYLKSLPSS